MTSKIAFVGAGPTTIYTLKALIDEASSPFSLTIFEEQSTAGRGTPYRPGWNDPAMLSNIASIEIPPLEETLVDWLQAQPATRLLSLGVDPDAIGERTFYPRLTLGEYFYAQFRALLDRAVRMGIEVAIRTRCRVVDAVSEPDAMVLLVQPRHGPNFEQRFDHVVLATGHQWPAEPEVRPGYFISPWPASALAAIPPCKVGIRGTSLSAIDASVALAVSHGEFIEGAEGRLEYVAAPHTAGFQMTMISRKGLLPEADFFAPLPYEPLSICTAEAIEGLIGAPEGELLDLAFTLFKLELAHADSEYATKLDLPSLTLEQFHDAYFADRVEADPFEWAQANLDEAARNYEREFTVPWRYAILRMHEAIAPLIPYLEEDDFKRFSTYFKPVFVDDYATVPHESIRRMLALHDTGKLEILAVGDDYRVDTHRSEGGATLMANGARIEFDAFIEATGQRALPAKVFPFPSLLRQDIVRDAADPNASGGSRGIAIDDLFHPISDDLPQDQLFCLSLPFILGRHPFIQGITSSHEMGQIVAKQLAIAIEGDATSEMLQNSAVAAA